MNTTQQHDDGDCAVEGKATMVVEADFDGYVGYVIALPTATQAQIEREIVQTAQVVGMELGKAVPGTSFVRYPLVRK